MPLEHFEYQGLTAHKATEELVQFGTKILDCMLNYILILQSSDGSIKPQIKTRVDLQSYYHRLLLAQEHYKSMPLLKTRSEARQTYFQHGRIFNIVAALADLRTRHNRIFTTGTFSVEECIEALEIAQQIRRLANDIDIPEFSRVTDEIILFINQLPQDIDNIDQLFPSIDFDVNTLDFAKSYRKKVRRYIDELIKTLAISGVQCIDENLRNANIFLCERDCINAKVLASKIPSSMQIEKEALAKIAAHIAGKEYEVADLFRTLLRKVDMAVAKHKDIDGIAEDTDTKVVRLAYYQQDLDKACYFNVGLCYGAAKSLRREDVIGTGSRKPSSSSQYKDLHNMTADENMFELQNAHTEFVDDFPDSLDLSSKTHKTRNFDSDTFGTLETFERFAESILRDIDVHSESEFAAGLTQGPYVDISLLNDSGVGHALAIQKRKHASGKYFYRFLDYNAGQFLISSDPMNNTIPEWFARYFSHLGYEKYNRYQIKICTPKIPTVQDNEDFKLRAKLRSLFIAFDDILHHEDYAVLMHEILTIYELINNKHTYDHYAAWTRVSACLNMPLHKANIILNKSIPFFCHMSFVLLARCNQRDIFKPMYNAHKFLSLRSALIIALRTKQDKIAKYFIKEIISVLGLNLLQGAESEALAYVNALASNQGLKHFNDFKNLMAITDALISMYFDREKNAELMKIVDEYCDRYAYELNVTIDTMFFDPTAPDEYAFYYSSAFNQHSVTCSNAPITSLTTKDKPETIYTLPLFYMFTVSPTRYLQPTARVDALNNGKTLAICDSSDKEKKYRSITPGLAN